MVSGLSNSRLVDSGRCAGRPAWRDVEVLLLAFAGRELVFFQAHRFDDPRRGISLGSRGARNGRVRRLDRAAPTGRAIPGSAAAQQLGHDLAAKLTGQLNLVAIRLPTVMATLLSTLLIYVYGRNFLSRMGSFAAART